MFFQISSRLIISTFVFLGWTACLAQTSQTPASGSGTTAASEPQTSQPLPGSISGTVVDQSGAFIAGAVVKLTSADKSVEVRSDDSGQFSFTNIAPGPFQLTITAATFAQQTSSGVLQPGQTYLVPRNALIAATAVTDIEVGVPQVEVAEEQIKIEEQQRVLGILPNFYVSYIPNAVPLTAKQKFKLATRTVVDPFTFVIVGGTAGIQQAQNHFRGYGQGTEGYAKRFGAGYGDTVSGTFIGGAILPALLKQDPRYFYKGTGSTASRFLYAVANAFICKGDNRRWQPNYSNMLGDLASGGISNLYYPAQDRNGVGLTFENAAVGIGSSAVANLFQEFIIRRLTPKAPHNDPAKTQTPN